MNPNSINIGDIVGTYYVTKNKKVKPLGLKVISKIEEDSIVLTAISGLEPMVIYFRQQARSLCNEIKIISLFDYQRLFHS